MLFSNLYKYTLPRLHSWYLLKPGTKSMQFRKSSFAGIRCTCLFFPNGSIKTLVEAVQQTCCEQRNYLNPPSTFIAGHEICASFFFIDIAPIYHPHESGSRWTAKTCIKSVFTASKLVEISLFCTWHFIGWRKECWNLLFPFCFVFGQLCLSDLAFCSLTVISNSSLAILVCNFSICGHHG